MRYGKKFMDKLINESTYLRKFYAPDYASITLSFFDWKLSLRFYRYLGKNNDGSDWYDLKNGITTTVDYEGASYLHKTAIFILKGRDQKKEIKAELPCNNATVLT
jgi:hypothetical protein